MQNIRQQLSSVIQHPGLVLTVLLALAGCLAIYNATYFDSHPYYFVYRQLAWLVMGVVLLIVSSSISAPTWCRYAWPLTIISVVMLFTLLLVGHSVRGMRGWFSITIPWLDPVLSPILLQPSELVKPFFVICLANIASDPLYGKDENNWQRFGYWCLIGGIWMLPIFLQPDFGTLAVYGATFLVVYFLQGGRIRHLGAAVGAGVVMIALAAWLHPYVRGRLASYLSPTEHAQGAGWHVMQFQATLANGGWLGSSDALWSRYYLPLGYSDSIFATIGEKVGFLGLLVILVLVVLFLMYGLRLARRQVDFRASLIVSGITAMLGIQALMHVSVTLGLLPPTGITFPLLSYGGSSLCSTMLMIGILLGVANKGWEGICKDSN